MANDREFSEQEVLNKVLDKTTNELKIKGGGASDETAATPGTTNATLIAAVADETTPDSVAEGVLGYLRMTLTRFLKVSLGDLIEGEDQTNHVMKTEQQFVYTNIASATTTTVKSGAGFLHSITINKPVNSATITIYDNTAGSGTIIGTITLSASATGADSKTLLFNVKFTTGLTIVTSGATDLTISTRA